VAIKVIVELQAKPGMRDELKSLLESMVSEHGPSQRGFLGSARYQVLDDPDKLIEIADWESSGARAAHMEGAAAHRSERRLSRSCPDRLAPGRPRFDKEFLW
jgi:quinol monooxygenase YgiN